MLVFLYTSHVKKKSNNWFGSLLPFLTERFFSMVGHVAHKGNVNLSDDNVETRSVYKANLGIISDIYELRQEKEETVKKFKAW
jgi:hypothetical protein